MQMKSNHAEFLRCQDHADTAYQKKKLGVFSSVLILAVSVTPLALKNTTPQAISGYLCMKSVVQK